MELISCKTLVSRVLEDVGSYTDAGMVDPGMFYRWIKEEVNDLNIPGYAPVKLITKLDGNSLLKPDNLKLVWSIWKIDPCVRHQEKRKHFQYGYVYFKEEECFSTVKTDCKNIISAGETIVTKYYLEDGGDIISDEWCNRRPLKIVNPAKILCPENKQFCLHNSPYEVRNEKFKFTFNFYDEWVYLEYFSHLLDDKGLPLVPDESIIEKSIEDYILYRWFRHAYINNLFDAFQRMQLMKQEYFESHRRALGWVKTTPFSEFLKYMERKNGELDGFEQQRTRTVNSNLWNFLIP